MQWVLLTVAVLACFAAIALGRNRRDRAGESNVRVDPLAGTRADPAHPGAAWMFPGRGTPTAQDVRETAVTEPDRRPQRPLPPGIQREGGEG